MYEAYRDGDIKLQRAAARVGMSEDDFLKAGKEILASDAAKDEYPI